MATTRQAVRARMLELVIRSAGEMFDGEVSEDSTFEQLGMDSLDVIELVMAVEEEWHLAIPDEDTEKLKSVADLVELVSRKVAP